MPCDPADARALQRAERWRLCAYGGDARSNGSVLRSAREDGVASAATAVLAARGVSLDVDPGTYRRCVHGKVSRGPRLWKRALRVGPPLTLLWRFRAACIRCWSATASACPTSRSRRFISAWRARHRVPALARASPVRPSGCCCCSVAQLLLSLLLLPADRACICVRNRSARRCPPHGAPVGDALDGGHAVACAALAPQGKRRPALAVLCIVRVTAVALLPQVSLLGLGVVHCAAALTPRLERYPDLQTYFFTLYGFVHLFGLWAALSVMLFALPPRESAGSLGASEPRKHE